LSRGGEEAVVTTGEDYEFWTRESPAQASVGITIGFDFQPDTAQFGKPTMMPYLRQKSVRCGYQRRRR
jgi:hypothetical protein